jgi:hypothetical protein
MLESDGTWQKMSVTEREKITKVYSTTCTRHLSNTFLDGGSKAEQKWLGGKLEDSLASAEAQALRVSSDITALVRAVSKDVGEGIKVYAKGSSTKFRAWLEKHHTGSLFLHTERVDLGVRQDSKTEAAFAVYYNRPIVVSFLETVLLLSGQNKLKDNLFVSLTSLEIIATLRARAVVHDKVTTRMRFFSASESLEGWSVLDMAPVFGALRDALRAGVDNPSAWLERSFDIFDDLAEDTPEYADFLRDRDGALENEISSISVTLTRIVRDRPTGASVHTPCARRSGHRREYIYMFPSRSSSEVNDNGRHVLVKVTSYLKKRSDGTASARFSRAGV